MNIDILNYQCSGPHLHFLHEPSHADHHLLLIPGKAGCQTVLQWKELTTLSGRWQPWSQTPPPDRLAGLCIVGSMTTGGHIFWETRDKRWINLILSIEFETRGWRLGRRWRGSARRRLLCSGSPSPHSAQNWTKYSFMFVGIYYY